MSTKKIFVKDLIIKKTNIPVMRENSLLKEALESMSKYKYGVCFCINKKGKLLGILTDGDIRRKILNVQKPFSALLSDDLVQHINKKPSKVLSQNSLSTALKLMKKKLIWDLPVVDKNNLLIGMLHLHPIVKLLIKKTN
ncbi:CBS domain-containing protein [Candidatus Pelagibacter sp.]|jgi:DeoR family transcriptional regulator, catabolite repression regulator|nr:CBS domain-containing protein [Candidatus Pelagibacter sp.]